MSITDIYIEEGFDINEIDIDPDYYDDYDGYDEDVATIENVEEHDFAFYDSLGVSSY